MHSVTEVLLNGSKIWIYSVVRTIFIITNGLEDIWLLNGWHLIQDRNPHRCLNLLLQPFIYLNKVSWRKGCVLKKLFLITRWLLGHRGQMYQGHILSLPFNSIPSVRFTITAKHLNSYFRIQEYYKIQKN